ncbi:heterokaryon incompatibility protein-domain-containing protein [Nemania abortiva]|nr:heterokaryon incompatibility protein-domain-containing protein [Nemania abortiva]
MQAGTESILPEDQLCDTCNNLRFPLGAIPQGHVQGYEILSSLAERCAFCRLIRDGIRQCFIATSTLPLHNEDLNSVDRAIIGSVIRDNWFVRGIPGWVSLQMNEISDSLAAVNVYASPRAYCRLQLIKQDLLSFDIPIRNDKAEAERLLWNARAYAGEPKQETQRQLPTRLIDVGKEQDIFPRKIRLVQHEPGSRGNYLALSHRWSSSCHTTTTENLEEHLREIPEQKLPQTFSNAVTICKYMDIQYLWIDSLCIVQNDEVDWKTQSKLMGDIYQNAFCTIAAHSAKDDSDSFLHNTLLKRGQSALLGRRGTQKWEASSPSHFARDYFSGSSISSRGWVLQERLLSRQILHFLPGAIYWESTESATILSADTGESEYFGRLPVLSQGLDSWFETVEWYSRCNLTKGQDKLPALAGVATKYQQISFSHYLAGIWGPDISRCFLWVAADGKTARRPAPLRAPTFSWASLDGPVIYMRKDTDKYASINNSYYNALRLDGTQGPSLYEARNGLIWIDEPASLCFLGSLAEMPQLGNPSESSSSWSGNCDPQRFRVISSFPNSDLWYRSIILQGKIVGWAILDEDLLWDPCHHLQCFLLGRVGVDDVVLIVSNDGLESDQYRRVGLGMFYTLVENSDGSYILLSKIFQGLGVSEIFSSPRKVVLV